MISAEEFEAYNRGAAKIGDGAASAVEQRVLGWCRSHEGASVAEKREAATLIVEGFVQAYDDKAAEFASQWYDYRAEQGGARLKQAVTMTVYEPGSVDDVARYQAKKLAKEGDAAFARACGEFARNDAFRSLNETIIANVGRDRDKGAALSTTRERPQANGNTSTAGATARWFPASRATPTPSWCRVSSRGSCTSGTSSSRR